MLRYLTKVPGVRKLWRRFPIGPVPLRAEHDIWPGYPPYGYGIWSAATLAKAIGLTRITALECGVVTGNGLVCMEKIATIVGNHFGMTIDVIGIDTGKGLPPPIDYRDGAHIWGEGFYVMDPAKVRPRLKSAELVVGPIGESLQAVLDRPNLAPVGFVAVNLDYYSLTKQAFAALAATEPNRRLPRIYCFFDDILWPDRACHNDWFGELLAISEFNHEHPMKKLAKIPHLSWMRCHPNYWNEMIYVLHDFLHPRYTQLITPEGYRYRQI